MRKRECRKLVCACAAMTLRNDIDLGASYIVDGDSEGDIERMEEAVLWLARELERRAK
jgi:hypothetical protein